MNKTAVEWLIESIFPFLEINKELGIKIIEQAKEIERQQINKACYDGYYKEDEKYTYEYYDQTYGGKK